MLNCLFHAPIRRYNKESLKWARRKRWKKEKRNKKLIKAMEKRRGEKEEGKEIKAK